MSEDGRLDAGRFSIFFAEFCKWKKTGDQTPMLCRCVQSDSSASTTRHRTTIRKVINRVIACKTLAMAPFGGAFKAQAYPVGSTMIFDAPRFAAARMGVLVAIAPSINVRPSIVTGGKTPGSAALARIPSIADPLDR